MRILDVLDMKAGLVRLSESPHWEAWMETLDSQTFPFIKKDSQTGTIKAAATDKYRLLLTMAEMFTVSEEMSKLVTAVADSLPEDTEILAEDFPSLQGLLKFPEPITVKDMNNQEGTVISGVLWDIYGAHVHLYFLAPILGQYRNSALNFFGFAPDHILWTYAPQRLGHKLAGTLAVKDGDIELEDLRRCRLEWVEGEPFLVYEDDQGQTVRRPGVVNQDRVVRWLLAALKLMRQTLTVTEPVDLPRHAAKRFQRLNLNSTTSVISLRRHESAKNSEGSGREYSHRFLRRGHWRRQPYKEVRGGEWKYHTIFIAPTIVGDPDKPFLIREHVNALLR